MKKTKRIISACLALILCLSAMPTTVFAVEQTDHEPITSDSTPSVEVEITTPSQFNVQIPKKLVLTGLGATTDAAIPYTYKVQGSIAGNEQVKVVPDATVTMQQSGKEDNTGNITQEKQVWSCADFEALNGSNAAEIVWSEPTPGNILVENMSAGEWNGSFNFNIELWADPLPPDTDTMIYRVENLDPNIEYTNFTLTNSNADKIGFNYGEPLVENEDRYSYPECDETLVIPAAFKDGNVWYKVTSIGDNTFEYCTNLKSVTIPSTVTSIGSSAFYYCRKLTSINIPNSVTSIGEHAFHLCSLTSIEIPDSVTSIGRYAFSCCGLTSINIPNSVTSIEDCVLCDNGRLTSIVIPDSVTSIGRYAIGGSSITSIEIPDSVTSIGENAFLRCSNLTSVKMSNSVTSIGEGAFQNCSSLTSIEIPEGVTSIGEDTFDGCSSLTSIVIPDGVTSIGSIAFRSCGLTSIEIPDSVTTIDSGAFNGCHNLTSITFRGTMEQWNTISKGSWWNDSTGEYTIHCTDGCLSKSSKPIECSCTDHITE